LISRSHDKSMILSCQAACELEYKTRHQC